LIEIDDLSKGGQSLNVATGLAGRMKSLFQGDTGVKGEGKKEGSKEAHSALSKQRLTRNISRF